MAQQRCSNGSRPLGPQSYTLQSKPLLPSRSPVAYMDVNPTATSYRMQVSDSTVYLYWSTQPQTFVIRASRSSLQSVRRRYTGLSETFCGAKPPEAVPESEYSGSGSPPLPTPGRDILSSATSG